MKSLKEISWNVDEPTYRANPALSYSTLSSYERGGGFASLPTLFDKKESPSLLLGSLVDTLITGTTEEFDSLYLVADFPNIGDKELAIVKKLYFIFGTSYNIIEDISSDILNNIIEEIGFQANWKPETRIKVIKERCSEYYKLLRIADGKTVVSTDMYSDALRMVEALRTAPSSRFLFAPNDPFNPNLERLYQLKFKGEYDGIPIRIMADEIIVNHEKKQIHMIDLKTTKSVNTFMHSFYEWGYFHQAKCYASILKQNIEKDSYFKDFTITPTYYFVAIDKNLLIPCVFAYDRALIEEDVVDDLGKTRPYWGTVAKELWWYLQHPEVKLERTIWEQLHNNGTIKINTYEVGKD